MPTSPNRMVSHARIMFRKLRGSSSRSSHRSEPTPLAPAPIAQSETVDPSPRAIHISDLKESEPPTNLPRKPGSNAQSIYIFVVNAKGAADYAQLYRVRTHRNILLVSADQANRAWFISYNRERNITTSSTLLVTSTQITFAIIPSTMSAVSRLVTRGLA